MSANSHHHQLPYTDDETHSSASHAHPYPRTSKRASLQHVQELLTNIDVDLVLRGLPGANKAKVTDVYCPEVRRSPPTEHQHVSHLDVVSCWKGLSFRQAREIARWESLFKYSLESQVRNTVLRAVAKRLYKPHGGESACKFLP